MRRLSLFALLFSSFTLIAPAQNVSTILAEAAAALQNAGGIAATYDYRTEEGNGSGTFKYKAGKFVNQFDGQTIWYDGKTMWSLDEQFNEVTITTPASGDVATVNPVYSLANYKQNYTATLGQQTKESYEVVLNAKKETGPQIVRLRLTKGSYAPESIYMVLANGHAISISLNSYEQGRAFADETFAFPASAYPDAAINDLR